MFSTLAPSHPKNQHFHTTLQSTRAAMRDIQEEVEVELLATMRHNFDLAAVECALLDLKRCIGGLQDNANERQKHGYLARMRQIRDLLPGLQKRAHQSQLGLEDAKRKNHLGDLSGMFWFCNPVAVAN